MTHFDEPVSRVMETEVVTLQREDRLDLGLRHIRDLENARIGRFNEEDDVLGAARPHRNRQFDLVLVVAEAARIDVDIDLDAGGAVALPEARRRARVLE